MLVGFLNCYWFYCGVSLPWLDQDWCVICLAILVCECYIFAG